MPTLTLEIFNCAPVAEEQEGFYDIPILFAMFSRGFRDSPDGITYDGFRTEAFPNGSITETWHFTGTEN